MKTIQILLLFLTALQVPTAQAAPITFNTALPVQEGGLLFREQGIWMRMHDDPSPIGREMDVVAAPSVFVYGATSKLALMGVFPYLDKRLEIKSMGVVRKASGLGDIMTAGRYQIYESNVRGRTSRASVFAGLQWPSGTSTASDSIGPLPQMLQLGSGSYDPMAGMVWTAQWLFLELDGDFLYQRNTWANDFKFGDVLQEDISVQYRLWPRYLGNGVPSYIYWVLEVNSIYYAENESGGIKDNDSGGYQLFLTPALQWVMKRWVFEVGTQIPAVQNLNGNALRTNYNLLGSVRVWL